MVWAAVLEISDFSWVWKGEGGARVTGKVAGASCMS